MEADWLSPSPRRLLGSVTRRLCTLLSAACSSVSLHPPHSQPRALRHTTVLSNIMCPYRSVCGTDAAYNP